MAALNEITGVQKSTGGNMSINLSRSSQYLRQSAFIRGLEVFDLIRVHSRPFAVYFHAFA